MLKVIKREEARFRIQIYDLREKTSRTISATDHSKYNVEDIKKLIIECLEKFK